MTMGTNRCDFGLEVNMVAPMGGFDGSGYTRGDGVGLMSIWV